MEDLLEVSPDTSTAFTQEDLPTDNEAALMRHFEATLRAQLTSTSTSSHIILTELDGIQGRADLILAYINISAVPASINLPTLAALLSSPINAQILATLRYRTPRTWRYLTTATGLSQPTLRRHIRQLQHSGLLTLNQDKRVSLAHKLPWNMMDITAYEGKISNCRRALSQALNYRSFSRNVQIVMPQSSAQRAASLAHVFRTNGIGLISVGDDGATQTTIRAKKHRRPASRRLYLMAVGVILRNYLLRSPQSHSDLMPEPLQRV